VRIGTQPCAGSFYSELENSGRAIIEWVSQCRGRLNPFQTMLCKWKRIEEWGGHCERMNGRANVVSETGKRQLCRARSSPYPVSRFEDADGASRAGHFNTRGKTVRTRPDDDCVELHRRIVYAPIAAAAAPIAAEPNQAR